MNTSQALTTSLWPCTPGRLLWARDERWYRRATQLTLNDEREINSDEKANQFRSSVKCGFDGDDDLFLRSEVRIRVTDLAAFKAMVTGVISGADQLYETVKPFLVTP